MKPILKQILKSWSRFPNPQFFFFFFCPPHYSNDILHFLNICNEIALQHWGEMSNVTKLKSSWSKKKKKKN